MASSGELELRILELEKKKAELKISEYSFWKRLIPRVTAGASFGVSDILFLDPGNFYPYIIPKEYYRITISFSLNDLWDSSRESEALFELERLSHQILLHKSQLFQIHKAIIHRLTGIEEELKSSEKELSIIRQLLRFKELRFEQGKIDFDAISRARLDLIQAERNLSRLKQEQTEIHLKLNQGTIQ